MQYIFFFTNLLFAYFALCNKGEKRLLALLCGICIIPYSINIIPSLNSHRIVLFASLLSIIRYKEINLLSEFPNKSLIKCIFGSFILTGLFDSRGVIVGEYKAILTFTENFGYLIIGYLCYTDYINENFVYKKIRLICIILSLYSISSYILHYDFLNEFTITDSMINGERLRVGSLIGNSHVAGFAMSIFILLILYNNLLSKFNPIKDYLLYLLLLSVYLSGSRSALVCLIVGILFFIKPIFSIVGNRLHLILVIAVLAITIPKFGFELYNNIIDATKMDGGETGGSSIFMRTIQLDASLQYFNISPWVGNGFQYFWEVVKVKDKLGVADELFGGESYIFILLIERGIIQIIFITLLFMMLYIEVLKRKSITSLFILSSITVFLINIIITGDLYKWPFALLLIGYYLRKYQYETIN